MKLLKKRWEYLDNDDSTMGNRCYDELLTIAKELRNEGKLGEIEVLLYNENEGIQLETASKLIKLNLRKAELVLEKLAEKKRILTFIAKMTLRQWKAGNLKF